MSEYEEKRAEALEDMGLELEDIRNKERFRLAVLQNMNGSGGSGGGGGSSDFSTAEVTTINDIGNSYSTGLSEVLEDDEYYEGFPSSLYPLYAKNGTETHNCVLYKGHAVAILDFGNNISVSGNIEKIFEDDVVYLITGDCTITIS